MTLRVLIVLLLMGCGPAEEARVRVVNAVSAQGALDVEVAGLPVARALRFGEVSAFVPVVSGAVPATVHAGDAPLLSTTLTLTPGGVQTLLLTPEPFVLTHAFPAPVPGLMRVRVFNGLGERAVVALPGITSVLEPGEDSGPEGLELAANRRAALVLVMGPQRLAFTVPALPAESEVLLVATRAGAPVFLAVAPSAALGLLQAEAP